MKCRDIVAWERHYSDGLTTIGGVANLADGGLAALQDAVDWATSFQHKGAR